MTETVSSAIRHRNMYPNTHTHTHTPMMVWKTAGKTFGLLSHGWLWYPVTAALEHLTTYAAAK